MALIVDGSTGVTFNDSSLQGAAASPYVLKNRIINGDMRIDQRNAGASVTATNVTKYTVDRFAVFAGAPSGAGVFTAQQVTDAPTGFIKSLKATVTATDTTATADGQYFIAQYVEGFNIDNLNYGAANAQTVTLSFWVKSSLTGTFAGGISNSAANRSYVFTYTISAANTWEQKTITISGDTTGTWLTDNGIGLRINFSLGSGSTFQTTAGSWAATYAYTTSGAIRTIGTLSATWQLTGVQLEVGTSATPFERRLYGQELINCQRYYAKMSALTGGAYCAFGIGMWISSTNINGFVKYPVAMRAAPTISYGGTVAVSYGAGSVSNISSVNSVYAGTDSALWQPTTGAVGTAGQAGTIMGNNDATCFVALTAEL